MALPALLDLAAPEAADPAVFAVGPRPRPAQPPRGLICQWTVDEDGRRLVLRWRRPRPNEEAVRPGPPARA
jgi:hypothetical protein